MKNSNRLRELFELYLKKGCNDEELKELGQLLQDPNSEQDLIPGMEGLWEKIKAEEINYPVEWESFYENVIQSKQAEVISIKRKKIWLRIAVAASILLLICTTIWVIVDRKPNRNSLIVDRKSNDIPAPGVTKAMITLGDGRTVSLDSLTSLTQGQVQITKTEDGKIVYSPKSGVGSPETIYNTLTNPRGSKVIDMQLADGSHVWLNAGSSITYPVAFVGKERSVAMTGEAYFEITHLTPQPPLLAERGGATPFIVKKGDMEVTVLGTRFNVNAFDDEADIKITLLEGSVKISNFGKAVMIKPGEQARVTSPKESGVLRTALEPQTSNGIDLDAVMSWKNGSFIFGGADLETVMRQIARWYDVEIEFQGAKPVANFRGEISRQESIAQVLKMLELTKAVKFRIDGKKIIVTK